MLRAAELSPHDPVVEINLAQTYERFSQKTGAESLFRRATADGPSYSPSYSSFGQWLIAESRVPEASQMASKAVALDPYDLVGRRTMMDVMAQNHEWAKLKQFAGDTLRLLPYDPDGQRSLLVAQTGLDQIGKAETQAKTQPTVDHYLALSVLYFQTQRYEDCIAAAREALKIKPDQAEAYANIASAYHALGKLDDTIAALREEVRLNPDLPSAKSNLAIELEVKEKSGR
jgi:tetratricopeptide (TPR) repeat protein